MKLYLSSYRLGDAAERLVEWADSARFALVANALDGIDPELHGERISRSVRDLREIGLDADLVDLREHFDDPASLAERLDGCRALFVAGGNVFVLRRALHRSGLDTWLEAKRDDPDFRYAGYSAGACVCGPTLRGLELVDDPSFVPPGYELETIWDGLGLVEHAIAPHYRSDHPESAAIEKVVAAFSENETPFVTLRDGEVLEVERTVEQAVETTKRPPR